jgi:hypothetical protein
MMMRSRLQRLMWPVNYQVTELHGAGGEMGASIESKKLDPSTLTVFPRVSVYHEARVGVVSKPICKMGSHATSTQCSLNIF